MTMQSFLGYSVSSWWPLIAWLVLCLLLASAFYGLGA
jgi:hypothetical protein